MNHPLVYIILLNWNGRDDTEECLSSLKTLTYPNFRIVLVDNGSTDGSVEHFQRAFPGLNLIENKSNLGFVLASNQGIEYGLKNGADYLFVLNNDTVVLPDVLDKLIRVAQSDPGIAAVAPKICYYDNPDRIWCLGGRICFPLGYTWHIAGRRKDGARYQGVRDVPYLTGCALLLKRTMIEEIGPFDPAFSPGYFEDTDLCMRIRRKGYRLLCVGQARILHKVSRSSGGGATPLKTYLKIRNGAIFFNRYAHPAHWLTMPLAVAANALLTMCLAICRGKPEIARAVCRGFYDLATKGPRRMECRSLHTVP
jgi:hypothetical protein